MPPHRDSALSDLFAGGSNKSVKQQTTEVAAFTEFGNYSFRPLSGAGVGVWA